MRIATEAKVLETSDTLGSWESTIATSQKTFRMVIDGIYSDKPGAICQEIAANAYDSHLRAGQTKPFFVHCPTVLLPEFYVRDYGTGMTEEVIRDTYIVVGKSDKDMSDDEVGMWGLGSKSPFAYTDQYYITCYDGESARHYGYGISAKGVPTLYLMQVEESTEERGVRIGFAVEPKDFDTFQNRIQKVSIGHNGNFESNIPLASLGEIAFSGTEWQSHFVPDTGYGGEAKSGLKRGAWYVRQGCILYPISTQNVQVPTTYNDKNAYILDCPIGSVQITTSREAIQYDGQVIEYLKGRIAEVTSEIETAVWDRVKDIQSVAEYFATIEKIRPSWVTINKPHPRTGLTSLKVPLTYPGLYWNARFQHESWQFSPKESLDITVAAPASTIFVLDEIKPLLDPSRGDEIPKGHNWLTKSEMRRISRFTRAYLERNAKKVNDALFVINANWSEDFVQACFPKMQATMLKFADLRDSVPMRVAPPMSAVKQPLRGLALAKAAGDQKPVFEIATADTLGPVAWVTSEQYRRQAAALFKMLKRFDFNALYVVAPQAEHYMKDAGIPHLKDGIEAILATKGLTFSDWYFVKDHMDSGTSYREFFSLLRTLNKSYPKLYDSLEKGSGPFSVMAKGCRRLLTVDRATFAEDENRALAALVTDEGTKKTPEPGEDMKPFLVAWEAVKPLSYYNPCCEFVSNLSSSYQPDQYPKIVKALIALQAIIPATEKYV